MGTQKIKVAMITNKFSVTGISTIMLNYCKALDSNNFDLSIIAGEPIAIENSKECKNSDIKLVTLPSKHDEPIAYYTQLLKIMRKQKYNIVHVHGSSSIMAIELNLARIAGVKIRIAHSHNSVCQNMLIHKMITPVFKKSYSKALACGALAGNFLFGENNYDVLPNGFYTERFCFDECNRIQIRRELEIEDCFVIGHIGRFNEQKNQQFLLKIFEQVVKKRKDVVLLLVGTGPDFELIKEMVDNLICKDKVILYGVTEHTEALYSAMDVFVLPSRYEGLPVVLLEAQMSGLPCVVSDAVTNEVDFGNIEWKSIYDNPKVWAETILSLKIVDDMERKLYYETHKKKIAEYDIVNTHKELEKVYYKLIEDTQENNSLCK